MIIKNGTNANIEKHKQKLGLTGDVYLVNDHFMESLESHHRLFPDSTATTIEDAMAERIAYEQEQERIRLEQAAQAEQERITARAAEDGETNNEETKKE
jgi:hypothetical protein